MGTRQESTVVMIGDIHFLAQSQEGKEIVRRALMATRNQLARQVRDLAPHANECVIMMAGDMVSTPLSYTRQRERPNVPDEAERLAEEIAALAVEQVDVWGRVRIEAVPSYHARMGRHYREENLPDMLFYRILRARLAHEPRVSVGFNPTGVDPFVRRVDIQGRQFLLDHGRGIRLGNLPWRGVDRRVQELLSSTKERVDAVCIGHTHCLGRWEAHGVDVFCNGSVSTDFHRLRTTGIEDTAAWWAFGVAPFGTTWAYQVHLGLDGSTPVGKEFAA